jgi:adenosylhomocysteine nucleosidase
MKIKLFVALESELPKSVIPEGVEVYYTGVGKVNAAIKATEIPSPDYKLHNTNTLVINYGSAGSKTIHRGTLVKCKAFVQYDMQPGPFGVRKETPFDELIYPELKDSVLTFKMGGYVCRTQDKFETDPDGIYDMEAYSIAKVCKIYGYDFTAYKYISDAGNSSDWQNSHDRGINLFLAKLNSYLEN